VTYVYYKNAMILQISKKNDDFLELSTRLSKITSLDYSMITHDKKLIHLDIDYDTIGKVYMPYVGIVADAREGISAMTKLDIDSAPWKLWSETRHEAYLQTCKLELQKNDVINKKVMATLLEKLPEDTLLTNDAGNFAGWLHSFYSFNQKHTYVGPTSGAMGYGMPAALGAKLAFPNKTIVALAGDGGFMMTVQELETAVRHDIPIIVLVFNNNMYGTIRMHQEMH